MRLHTTLETLDLRVRARALSVLRSVLAVGICVLAFASGRTASAQQNILGLDIWYVDEPSRTIYRVDRNTGALLASFPVPAGVVTPAGLAVTGNPGGPRALWLLDSAADVIWRLNANTGALFNIIPAPDPDAIGIGSACIVPGNVEEVFVVAGDANQGVAYWINPVSGDVISYCILGVGDIRDAAAFPLGSYGTGTCVLRNIDPGGCEIICYNKLTCRVIWRRTYAWEGWGLGNWTVGNTDAAATELFASDLGANVLHVIRAADGQETGTIPTLVNGAGIRGVGGDNTCPLPTETDLCLPPSSFQTNFQGNTFFGSPTLDPGACAYFDLDVASGLSIDQVGLNFFNDGGTYSGITVPNLIGTTAGIQVWIVDITNGQNGGSVLANLPRPYTINPLVLPGAPWNATGPDATGTMVIADVEMPSLTTSLTPLHLNAGSYGVCIVMVPNGTSTSPPSTAGSASRLHPLFTNLQTNPISPVVRDQVLTLTTRGMRARAFDSGGAPLMPNILVNYTLDPGAAYSVAHGSGCYDQQAPTLTCVDRPRHGALLRTETSNLDPSIFAVLTFLSPSPVAGGVDLGILGMPGCSAHIFGPWLAEGLDLTLGQPGVVTTFGVIPPIGAVNVHAQSAALSNAAPPLNGLNVILSQALCLHIDAN